MRSLRWTVALRVLLGLLACPIAFVLAAPASTSIDFDYRHQAGMGNRLITLYRQCEAVAQGHYLTDESGGSFTRDANEVVGPNLLLADVALVRAWLGLSPPSFNEMLRWQSHLAAFAVLAMLAAGAPLWTIAFYLLLLWLYPTTPATLTGQRAWPQLIAVGLAVCALASLVRWATREQPRALGLAGLLLLAFCAGLIGLFRDEARAHFLVPLLLVGGASAMVAVLRLGLQRGSFARLRRLGPAGVSFELRIVLAVGIATAGVVSVHLVRDLNLFVFELIEHVEHRPRRGSHLLWHSLYLGLGYEFHSQENIEWHDPLAVADMHAATGSFTGFDEEYERQLRNRYLEIAWLNTPYFVRVHLQKVRVALFGEGRSTTTTLSLLVALLVTASAIALRHRGDAGAGEACLLLGGVGLAGITLAPGVMGGAQHLQVLDAGLLSAAALAGATLVPGSHPNDTTRSEPSYPVCLGRVLRGAAVVGLILLSALCWRVLQVEGHRRDLSADLASGELSFEDLLSEYYVDASWAFNDLPRARRTAIAERVTTARSEPLDPGLRFAHRRGSSKVLAGIWARRSLFLLVELDPPSRVGSIPLRFEFHTPARIPTGNREALDFSPPHSQLMSFESLERKLFLPVPIEGSGPWLFSIRAPRANLDAIQINTSPLQVPPRRPSR